MYRGRVGRAQAMERRQPQAFANAKSALRGYLLLPTKKGTALLVGTVNGIFVSWPEVDTASGDGSGGMNRWTRLGTCEDLPLVLVMGISYEPTSDTLVAATMGRGVYVLHGALAAVERSHQSL